MASAPFFFGAWSFIRLEAIVRRPVVKELRAAETVSQNSAVGGASPSGRKRVQHC